MSICHIFHERFDSPLSWELFQGLVVCMAGEFAGGMGGYLCRMGCQQSVSELQMPCWQIILWNLHRRMFELFFCSFCQISINLFHVPLTWHQVRRNKFIVQFIFGNCRFLAALCTLGLLASVPTSDSRWCDAQRPATWVVQQNFQKLVIQQCQQQRFLMFLAYSGYNSSITHFSKFQNLFVNIG